MSEYFGPTSESDDDSDESPSSAERTGRAPERASAKPLGELLFGNDKAKAAGEKPHNLWERPQQETEKLGLFAALAEKATSENKLELDDDDDEEEAETEQPKAKPAEEAPEEIEADAESSLETLSDDEQKLVAKDYIDERAEQLVVERESIEENSPEDAAAAAGELYNEKLTEKLEDPEKPVELAIEEAAAETLAVVEAASEEKPQEAEAVEFTSEATIPLAAAEEEPEEETAAPVTPPVPPPTAGGASTGATGGGAGGATPPTGGTPYFGSPGQAPASHSAAPGAPGATAEDLYAAERRGQNRGLVAGGIVGYLLGRRRGRIRTEARLLPVQEKLEQQVKELQADVAGKERQVRNLAAEKARATSQAKRETMVEQLRPQPKPLRLHQLPGQPEGPVAREQLQPSQLERVPEIFKQPEAPIPAKQLERVERMSHAELLETSSKVMIDGTALRAIYEARQITEQGLRHILMEFLSGGDIKEALQKELLVKQLTYERDPRLRDQLSAGYSDITTQPSRPAGVVGDQLSSADGKQFIESSLAQSAGQQDPLQSDIPGETERRAQHAEQIIVETWLAIVVVLVIAVAVLLIAKR